LEHEAKEKHEKLMSYNKNYGINALKEHVCHSNLYKKWGLLLLGKVANSKSYKKPIK
jgi:hypothetical protein